MTRPDDDAQAREDAAFAEIVAHYGDRPDPGTLDTDPATSPDAAAPEAPTPPEPVEVDPEDRFVPPPPPPIAWPTRWRAVAWLGVVGAPVLLLVLIVLGVSPSSPVAYLLVGWFLGGFVGLVMTMRREPRDPWDDGSRV